MVFSKPLINLLLSTWRLMLSQLVSSFDCTLRLLCRTHPLLLAVRRPAINDRLAAVARGEAVTFLKETDERERPLNTWAVGINWERFSQEDLVEIVEVSLRFPTLALKTHF